VLASGTKGAQAGADFADQDLGLFRGREVPALSKRTPCDQSPTVSGSGHRVLVSRCFTSSISESEIDTVNGRTRAEADGAGAVIAFFS